MVALPMRCCLVRTLRAAARRRHAHLPGVALEEVHLEPTLKICNLTTDRQLHGVKLVCGAREVFEIGHRHEGLAQPILENIQKAFGRIPNVAGTMANAPLTLKRHTEIGANFAKAGFSPIEQQIVFLTVSVKNECACGTAAHSSALKAKFQVDASFGDAICTKALADDDKHDVLVATVRELVQQKGHLPDATRSAFLKAGYTPTQLIDLLSAIAMLDHNLMNQIPSAH